MKLVRNWIVSNLLTFAFKFLVLPWLWIQFYYVSWIKLFFFELHWVHMFWEVKTQGFISTKDHCQNYTRSFLDKIKKKKKKKPWNKSINVLFFNTIDTSIFLIPFVPVCIKFFISIKFEFNWLNGIEFDLFESNLRSWFKFNSICIQCHLIVSFEWNLIFKRSNLFIYFHLLIITK